MEDYRWMYILMFGALLGFLLNASVSSYFEDYYEYKAELIEQEYIQKRLDEGYVECLAQGLNTVTGWQRPPCNVTQKD